MAATVETAIALEMSTSKLLNAPKAENYLVTARGEKMHVRVFMPEPGKKVLAVVLFLHGVGGHSNSHTKMCFGRDMAAAGYAVIIPDLVGHGYSEGERCFIYRHEYYVTDVFQLLNTLLLQSDGGNGEPAAPDEVRTAAKDGAAAAAEAPFHFALTPEDWKALKSAPFFVSGESMGGALSLLVGLKLQEDADALSKRFKGAMLIAPAIKAFPPPAPVVFLLRYLVVPFARLRPVPNFLESVHRPELAWKTEEARAQVRMDAWGQPGGLGYGHNMKFGMGLALIDMIGYLQAHLADVKYPFLVIHDPTDGIVSFQGTRMLLDAAQTPPEDRKLVELPGDLHDILCNAFPVVLSSMQEWAGSRLG